MDAPESSREIYSNPWISVREDIIRLPNGEPSVYAVVDKSDFALIIPQDGERFQLIEQFRYPLQERCWEFPGGSVRGAETFDAVEAARTELREETGLRAENLTLLGKLAPASATCSHRGHVFLATGLTEGPHEREPSEADMRAAWFTRTELEAMIADGRINCGQTVSAYLLLLLHERTGRSESSSTGG
ncbi:NUDIX domain-containing protein [Nocardia huaxiensis]|uniref:NUDIX hydrolase n=1 Tax=Nocardia huaxiensis TaxID=2755382 RepID=A0A7D6Z5K0_9NOCA|nr:NUDIX hydrolase [Nocardia huaxiensis]QLY33546.1 NUDIX hydrolase [Nocardia huaxiensis]UFS99538.1 NUDIX hydrolase [Nocardia huaxiensis]